MFDFEKLSASKFYQAPKVERVVEFSPPDIDMQNISRILSLAVDTKPLGVETKDGEACVRGRANFRLIYLDGEGDAKGVDYNADFTVDIKGDFEEGESAFAKICVVEADVTSNDGLLLSSVLEVQVGTIKRQELQVLVNAQKCYKTTKQIVLPTYVGSKNASTTFEEQKEIGEEIESVLSLSTSAVVKSVASTQGGVELKSELCALVTYIVQGDVKQVEFCIPLEDEFSLDGVQEGDSVQVDASVKNAKIVLQGVTGDNVISLEGELSYKLQVLRCQPVEVVDDLFTLTHEVKIERESRDVCCFEGERFLSQRITGTAVLADNRPSALEIVALPYARCYTAKWYPSEDGGLCVEGVVNSDVIYLDENGLNSVRTEIPFSFNIDVELGTSQKVCCAVEKINGVIRRDKEIEIEVVLAISVEVFNEKSVSYISSVEVGEQKVQNTSAISIYVASETDGMLDVCKALSAMSEDILAQNPSLQFPLVEGDKVVYFRAL